MRAMSANQKEILELMEQYTDATGIGLYCLNQSLVLQSFTTAGWSYPELGALDFAEVGWHMLEKIKHPGKSINCYEAFLTRQGFIYLIRELQTRRGARSSRWFLISEPMVEMRPGSPDQQAMSVCDPMAESSNPLAACPIKPAEIETETGANPIMRLPAMPVISHYRINQLGQTLDYLCGPFSGKQGGKHPASSLNQVMGGCMSELRHPEATERDTAFASIDGHGIARVLYSQVRSIIRNGQVSSLHELEKTFDFNKLPIQALSEQEQLLAAKDIFIAFNTLQMHGAVEAGLPYARMLRLADQQVDKVQRMTGIQDVVSHMKASVAAFTYAVHLDLVDRQVVPPQTSHHELLTNVNLARA